MKRIGLRAIGRWVIVVGVAATVAMAASGCAGKVDGTGDSGGPLKVGVIAVGTADEVKKQYEHTAADLSKALGGRKVDIVTSTDYFTIVEGLKGARLDLAFLGSLSYVLGKGYAAVEPLVVGVDKAGTPGYYSQLITTDPSIHGPADVRGRRLALAGKLSTSGYLFPLAALQAAGVDPAKDTTLAQGGNHAANIVAVKQGAADAAFVDSVEFGRAVAKGAVDPAVVRVVWQSERITGSPVVIRSALPASDKDAIKTALLTLKGTEEYPLGIERSVNFVAVDDAAYDPIRRLAQASGLSVDSLKK
jgi:phosphonate transport system substrate-binding protein